VATEAAILPDGNSVEETVGRWKARETDASMSLMFRSTVDAPIWFSGTPDMFEVQKEPDVAKVAAFSMIRPGISVPTFVIASYQKLAPNDLLTVEYLPGQDEGAKAYAEAAANIETIIPVGRGSESLEILGLPDPEAVPFVSEGMLLSPLKSPVTNEAVLNIVYAKARHLALSPRAWIQDGLAHYAQVAFIEENAGRQAALDYLAAHQTGLVESEKEVKRLSTEKPGTSRETARSLINAPDDLYLQTKAMDVWWMLRDMLGTRPDASLLNYHASEDKDAGYLQRVIEGTPRHDLGWFFEDWVYHDRGLPDFRVESVFSRPIESGGFLVTITVENLGAAGAEVPVTLKMEGGGEIRQRLEVRAKAKASLRMEAAGKPQQVTVNDGSVPESDMSNNTYKIGPVNH
jgi:hypothetical protein